LSGGLALASDFGVFYVPNITPDETTGVGSWTGRDFVAALRHGRSPSGAFYFPAFPYLSYAGMRNEDVLAIAAYLKTLPPVSNATPEHETPFWLARWMMAGWNRLATMGRPGATTVADTQIQRGAYLARNLGHCGECHTPRNGLGMPVWNSEFAGAVMGESEAEPIDAEAMTEWTEEDFAFFLFLGIKPDGEFVGGEMEPVIEHNTSKLNEDDRAALAAYFVRGQTPRE
jgi:mono/diheme cytochrome c family protein